MGLHLRQLRLQVVEPVLRAIGMGGEAAIRLMLGTAAVESRLRYLAQVGGGPALGIYQMEPATARDIVGRYLDQRQDIASRLSDALAPCAPAPRGWRHMPDGALCFRLAADLAFATALARVRYFWVPEPLPDASDVPAIARYWKRHFNTLGGAGTEAKFIDAYREIVSPHL